MIVLLDTDHFSLLQNERFAGSTMLKSRLVQMPVGEVKVSIISFQEQMQGWLAWINRAKKPDEVLRGFHDLQECFRFYSAFDVLRFDQAAMDEFMKFKQQRIRIGTSDLRIAAIAKSNGVKLLTRNLGDFRLVPGLDAEDWTA